MRALIIATISILVPATVSAQGGVKSITATPTAEVGKYQVTVTGDNPCGAVFIDLGDGSEGVTYAIQGLPYTVLRDFEQVGKHRVKAKGMGNCLFEVSTEVTVTAVRPRPAKPTPTPTPTPSPATAPPTTPRPTTTPLPAIRWAEMDTNGDREISRAEWKGSALAFAMNDRNHDNKLSGDEVRATTEQPANSGGGRSGNARGAGAGSAGAGGSGGAGGGGSTASRGRENAVNVSATREWTDTGLVLQAGDVLEITASGQVSYASSRGSVAPPNGASGRRATPAAPMPNVDIGALVGRIGDGPIFLVGETLAGHRATTGGRLMLRINDDVLKDNKGEFRAVIAVTRR